jgi:hypothetical protein
MSSVTITAISSNGYWRAATAIFLEKEVKPQDFVKIPKIVPLRR